MESWNGRKAKAKLEAEARSPERLKERRIRRFVHHLFFFTSFCLVPHLRLRRRRRQRWLVIYRRPLKSRARPSSIFSQLKELQNQRHRRRIRPHLSLLGPFRDRRLLYTHRWLGSPPLQLRPCHSPPQQSCFFYFCSCSFTAQTSSNQLKPALVDIVFGGFCFYFWV